MEYSKDKNLSTSYKTVKFIIAISIICIMLILVDIILIYGFANTLQSIL